MPKLRLRSELTWKLSCAHQTSELIRKIGSGWPRAIVAPLESVGSPARKSDNAFNVFDTVESPDHGPRVPSKLNVPRTLLKYATSRTERRYSPPNFNWCRPAV